MNNIIYRHAETSETSKFQWETLSLFMKKAYLGQDGDLGEYVLLSKEKMDMLEEHVLLFVRNKEKSRKLSAHCKNLYPLELSDSDEKTTKIIVDNDGSDEAETDAEVRVRPEVRDRPGGRDRPPRRSATLNADILRRLANS